jgi:hypothetical protein
MPTVIKSIKDLNKILEQRATMAMKMAQKDIGECIQESINEYYEERVFRGGTSCIPEVYDRTYKLLNSMVKTEIVKSGNTLSCKVGISDDYLNYKYPGTNSWDGVDTTGRDVLDWNNENGSHGGSVDGDWKIWDEAMRTLGGETGIMAIFLSKLKKCGIKVN